VSSVGKKVRLSKRVELLKLSRPDPGDRYGSNERLLVFPDETPTIDECYAQRKYHVIRIGTNFEFKQIPNNFSLNDVVNGHSHLLKRMQDAAYELKIKSLKGTLVSTFLPNRSFTAMVMEVTPQHFKVCEFTASEGLKIKGTSDLSISVPHDRVFRMTHNNVTEFKPPSAYCYTNPLDPQTNSEMLWRCLSQSTVIVEGTVVRIGYLESLRDKIQRYALLSQLQLRVTFK